MNAILAEDKKPHFSGHETFPLRQLWLPKIYRLHTARRPLLLGDDAGVIAELGVGRNMVTAMRHWGLATDFLQEQSVQTVKQGRGKAQQESKEPQIPGPIAGPLGDLLLGVDPWLEEPSSLWLIHWKLAGRGQRSTIWAWLFSCVLTPEFDRESLLDAAMAYSATKGWKVARNTLKRDIDTCLRCYATRSAGDNSEDGLEPLLTQLGLIRQSATSGVFSFNREEKYTLPPAVILYAVLDFWQMKEEDGYLANSISMSMIANDLCSPGRVFKIDEEQLSEAVGQAVDGTRGRLRWSDVAGTKVLTKDTTKPLSELKGELLEKELS